MLKGLLLYGSSLFENNLCHYVYNLNKDYSNTKSILNEGVHVNFGHTLTQTYNIVLLTKSFILSVTRYIKT